MLFLEEIAAAKRNIQLQAFASDINEDAIAVAREGRYPESIAADVSPVRLARFFTQEEHSYRVVPELRGVVVFTAQDVLADPPFSRLDLISCRNLLIYLRPEAQEKVLLLFHFALRESSILMLGGSETEGSLDDRFEPISKTQRIYPDRPQPARGSRFSDRSGTRRADALARTDAPGGGAEHQRSRPHATSAARDLCARFGPDQPQARVPLLLGTDRPLFAGGRGRA
jgi:two-component system CheB/CheR fusion protein